jgi:hypothetical protein
MVKIYWCRNLYRKTCGRSLNGGSTSISRSVEWDGTSNSKIYLKVHQRDTRECQSLPRPTSFYEFTDLASSRFVISQLLSIGIAQVMIECIYLIMTTTPYLSTSGRPDFSSDKYTTQAMVGYLVMANFYFSLRTIQAILSIIFTSIGYTTPSMWRPVFGTIIYDTTVRDRWGKGWHQLIRGSVASPGKWLCKQLSFEKGSFKSKYTQLYVGMFVSAVAHSRPASPTTSYPYIEYVFFLLQATYIMAEDHLTDWFEKKGYTNNGQINNDQCKLGLC